MMTRSPAKGILVCALVGGTATFAALADEAPVDGPARAVALYEAGRYGEALPLLEELDAAGQADGPLLYRLHFCRTAKGDATGASEALTRAMRALERENESATGLEIPFYLANTYRNLRRADDARRVAAAATSRFEHGEIPPPSAPIDTFRLAKLYEDQGRTADASGWYRRAIEEFERDPGEYPGNVRWAQRYLAKDAFARAAFAEAIEPLRALAGFEPPHKADLDQLAVAYVRIGSWGAAAETWRRVEKLEPTNADRARYASKLAAMAEDLGSLPSTDPAGRPWAALSKTDLETVLAEQARAAVDLRAPFTETTVTDEAAIESAREELVVVHAAFVAAGLEYTCRNLPIRETAFLGGYAPMVFHADRWTIPGP